MPSPLLLRPLTGLLYQLLMTNGDDCGAISGMNEWQRNPEVLGGRMASFGMLRRVAFVRTAVSEEPSPSFIRVTRIGELGITLAVNNNRRTLRRNTSLPQYRSVLHKSHTT
jgi:hypothetical protein